jgi:hypothetical protein
LTVSLSLVLLLGVAVWLMHRYAGLRFVHALVCFLFGFFVAATGAAPVVHNIVLTVISAITGRR